MCRCMLNSFGVFFCNKSVMSGLLLNGWRIANKTNTVTMDYEMCRQVRRRNGNKLCWKLLTLHSAGE